MDDLAGLYDAITMWVIHISTQRMEILSQPCHVPCPSPFPPPPPSPHTHKHIPALSEALITMRAQTPEMTETGLTPVDGVTEQVITI